MSMNNTDSTFEIKDYRQPMVTSLGVILGFLVGFLGQWVTEDNFALKSAADYTVFVGCFLGAVLLFTALFRMLSPDIVAAEAKTYYRKTLLIYMVGVVGAFLSILISAFV